MSRITNNSKRREYIERQPRSNEVMEVKYGFLYNESLIDSNELSFDSAIHLESEMMNYDANPGERLDPLFFEPGEILERYEGFTQKDFDSLDGIEEYVREDKPFWQEIEADTAYEWIFNTPKTLLRLAGRRWLEGAPIVGLDFDTSMDFGWLESIDIPFTDTTLLYDPGNEPVDPSDCQRWPNSPLCSNRQLRDLAQFKDIGLNIDYYDQGCTQVLQISPQFGIFSLPPFTFGIRKEECGEQLPDEPIIEPIIDDPLDSSLQEDQEDRKVFTRYKMDNGGFCRLTVEWFLRYKKYGFNYDGVPSVIFLETTPILSKNGNDIIIAAGPYSEIQVGLSTSIKKHTRTLYYQGQPIVFDFYYPNAYIYIIAEGDVKVFDTALSTIYSIPPSKEDTVLGIKYFDWLEYHKRGWSIPAHLTWGFVSGYDRDLGLSFASSIANRFTFHDVPHVVYTPSGQISQTTPSFLLYRSFTPNYGFLDVEPQYFSYYGLNDDDYKEFCEPRVKEIDWPSTDDGFSYRGGNEMACCKELKALILALNDKCQELDNRVTQQQSTINRIFMITGGAYFEYDDDVPQADHFIDTFLSGFINNIYNSENGETLDQPQRVTSSLDILLYALSAIFGKLGLDQLPTILPETLIKSQAGDFNGVYDDTKSGTQIKDRIIKNQTELTAWQIEQFDSIMGEWFKRIVIQDLDPTTPGDQQGEIVLPNIAEAIAELVTLAFQTYANTDALLNMGTRTLIESGSAKIEAIKGRDIAQAIADYLNFGTRELQINIPSTFSIIDPEEVEADGDNLAKVLTESEIPATSVLFNDNRTLRHEVEQLLQAAAIIRAANFEPVPKGVNPTEWLKSILNQAVNFADSGLGELETEGQAGQDLDNFFEDVERGFTNLPGTTPSESGGIDPYQRDYDRRPRIRRVGTDVNDG